MKRKITIAVGGLAAAAAYFVLSALPAFSADSSTVNATVSVAAPCVTVGVNWPSAPSLDFGSRAFTTPSQPGGTGLSGAISVTNCASGAENVLVRGTDAAGTTSSVSWQLQGVLATCSVGVDKYALQADIEDANGQLQTPSTILDTANKQLANINSGSRWVTPRIWMPCTGSKGAGDTMSFQIVFTASL